MSVDSLPAELVDQTVKLAYNGDDILTLTSCALVCSGWNAASRRYIFERVRVSSDDRLTALEDLVERDPEVGPYIRTLVVRPSMSVMAKTSSLWIGKLAKKLPAKLTCLQTIECVDLHELGDAFDGDFVHELEGFSSVERLTFDQSALHFSLLYALAAALPGLRHLSLGFLLPLPSMLIRDPEQLHTLQLTSVGLDVGSIYPYGLRDASHWVLGSPSRHTLRSLTIVARHGSHAAVTGHVLNELGPQLEELDLKLEIVFPSSVEAEVIRMDISLAKCRVLRKLTMRHHTPVSRAVRELVSEVPAPLRTLALGVVSAADAQALPDFGVLQAHIAARISTLQEVLLLSSGPVPEQVVLAKLQRDLPVLHAKGVLKVIRLE